MKRIKLGVTYKKYLFILIMILFSISITINSSYASEYVISFPTIGITNHEWKEGHAVITELNPQYQTELQKGDIIGTISPSTTNHGMTAPKNQLELLDAIFSLVPGKEAKMMVYRNGKSIILKIIPKEKKVTYYYNDNLKKIGLYNSSSDLLNPIYAGKCFFIYANNNYENLITKILNGSVSPENAAVDVKSSLYILYDRANVSKKQSKEDIYNKKDVYVILNYFIYDLIKRLSEVPKKPEDVDSSVAIFNHIMMTEYFEPNYNDIPGFNNVLQKVNNDYAIIESRQEKDIAIINNKYNNVKGGWKFLKWGMSIDESNKLLIKNGMRQLFIEYPINRIDIAYGPQNDEYFDAKLTTQASSEYTSDPKYTRRWDFYFINEKLMAVSLYAGKDINEVSDELKKRFPNGTQKVSSGKKSFYYADNNNIVYMGMGKNFIWYASPEIKVIKNNIITNKEQQIKKEKENNLKEVFKNM